MKHPPRFSPLALAVLALLYEAPMHPYGMQRLIKERGKDEVINVRQRASLYQTIERLRRDGLIAVRETARAEKRPERTVYALTGRGRETTLSWLRAMLSTPAREFPAFPAAVAHLPLLTPEDALGQLETRARALEGELTRIDAQLRGPAAAVPRLFLLETEYLRAMLDAELAWVRAVVDDLRAGRLSWSDEWLRQAAIALGSAPDTTEEAEP
jgi:DNA-binding PadR family transcriptional regulator